MPTKKSLFNLNRMVRASVEDTSLEVSFLSDLDYTIRSMNKYKPHYYFKEITSENDAEYFNPPRNVVCLDKLPESEIERYAYDKIDAIVHTNDQKYYVCLLSDGKPSRMYKPSSLHCIRCMYYQMIGADLDKESEKSGDFYGICESGEDRHIRIQRSIKKMRKFGIDCDFIDVEDYVNENNLNLVVVSKKECETKLFDKDKNLTFLCDGIIKYKGKYYILEIKTEISYKWMQRDCLDNYHKYQAYAYSMEFGIDNVLFIYENRDLCTKKSFILNVSDENRKFILDRLSKCDEYVSQHITPPKDEEITKKVCQYCDYKTICKLDDCL